MLQTGKGLLYVVVSGLLLLLAIHAMEVDEIARRVLAEYNLRLLRESGLIGVATWDTDRSIHYANEALCRLLDYDRNELIGTDVRKLVPPECLWIVEQARKELDEHGRTQLYNYELLRRDGVRVPIIGGFAKVEPSTKTAYFVDISELTKSEAERARLTEQLRNSEKLNALGQLAGGVAHNFNNELAIIVGYASMIAAGATIHDAPRRADQILKAAERARKLVSQLLAFSRKQSMHCHVVDLNVVLGEIVPALRQVLKDNIDLKFNASNDPEFIEIDQAQLEQSIVNLAVNAQDAMPDGGTLTIDVGHYATSDGQKDGAEAPIEHARVTVSDTGCGMDEVTAARVFEPFFTTKQRTGGTGLGLSTVHGIVKQGGGDITVSSRVGEGTRFTLRFPKAHKPSVEHEEPEAIAPELITGTVLLVEDMDALRQMMTEILTAKGLTILSARDGVQAVEIAREHKGNIDMVLTDVVMPRMNGPEAARRIRETHPEAKVAYFSGYSDLVDPREGAVVIWKPVRPEALIRTVRECLIKGSGSGSRGPSNPATD